MYCKNCGTKLDDDAKFCANCGAPTGNAEVTAQRSIGETASVAPYMKYLADWKRINASSAAGALLLVLCVLSCIFLPIFQFEYEPQSLKEWDLFIDDEEELMEYLKSNADTVKENFSAFDDMSKNFSIIFSGETVKYIKNGSDTLHTNLGWLSGYTMAYVALIIIGGVAAIVFFALLIRGLNPEGAVSGIYQAVKNSSKKAGLVSNLLLLFLPQILPLLGFFVSVLTRQLEVDLLAKYGLSFAEVLGFVSPMMYLSGISPWIIVPIGLFVMYVIVTVVSTKHDCEQNHAMYRETHGGSF